MANVRERVDAEIELVRRILSRLPPAASCSRLSELELAGVAALLHGFYNGIENILKQVLLEKNVPLPSGESWHRDLITLAVKAGAITGEVEHGIRPYLAFRHFFSHAYALDLYPARIEPLVANAAPLFELFSREVAKVIQ